MKRWDKRSERKEREGKGGNGEEGEEVMDGGKEEKMWAGENGRRERGRKEEREIGGEGREKDWRCMLFYLINPNYIVIYADYQ